MNNFIIISLSIQPRLGSLFIFLLTGQLVVLIFPSDYLLYLAITFCCLRHYAHLFLINWTFFLFFSQRDVLGGYCSL